MREKKDKYYTLVLVPHDSQKEVLRLRFSRNWVYGILAVFLSFMLLASASFIYSATLARRLAHYHLALETEQEQKQVIDQFSSKTEQIKEALYDLSRRDNELRKLLGLKKEKFGLETAKLKLEPQKELEAADQLVARQRASLEQLQERVSLVKERFANTPSIWPVRGRLNSFFGYRSFPWRGFHSGIDIDARYGAPVKTSANGIIQYVGWIKGYGKAVVVDHGYNISTLYGHLSKIDVKSGDKVVKGMLIGRVGATGYSTGPHLHYEVRWSGYAVNPVRYLNLDLFTASKLL